MIKIYESILDSSIIQLDNGEIVKLPENENLVEDHTLESNPYFTVNDTNAKERVDVYLDSWEYTFVYSQNIDDNIIEYTEGEIKEIADELYNSEYFNGKSKEEIEKFLYMADKSIEDGCPYIFTMKAR